MILYHFKKLIFIFVGIFFSLIGCSNNSYHFKTSLQTRFDEVDKIAKSARMKKKFVSGGNFILATYQKIGNPKEDFVFYLEGDGVVSNYFNQVSTNPTPISTTTIELAALDNRANVVYIARPCQLVDLVEQPICTSEYWTTKRMSHEVVTAMNQVIKQINPTGSSHLIGFSGGGGISVLIATKNPHIKDIITVAGNLDHELFNKIHRSQPMIGSLNPINYAKQISQIPQLHLTGGRDKVVTKKISTEYVERSNSPCVRRLTIASATHNSGWNESWPNILKIPLNCANIR